MRRRDVSTGAPVTLVPGLRCCRRSAFWRAFVLTQTARSCPSQAAAFEALALLPALLHTARMRAQATAAGGGLTYSSIERRK
jgi:hypothetical protein